MNIVVLGAGAVGCYYGGRLAEAGHDVTLIGRPAHVAAIREHGLTIDSRISGITKSRPSGAKTFPPDLQPDLIFISVKAFDTETAARSLPPDLGSRTVVLSLQNGVGNHSAAQGLLPPGVAVYPTVVYVAVGIARPGVVSHQGRGEIVLPEELSHLAGMFEEAGVPASTTSNIEGMLWNKLLLNASLNALSMITDTSFGTLAGSPHGRAVVERAVAEVMAVAETVGVDIGINEPVQKVLETAESLGSGMSSMWQDFRAGKRIEIEALNGVVVTLGQENGIATPVNATLHAAASLMEQRRDAARSAVGG